jgi:tetratricopeptide (TPR) repeat protein
MRWTNFVAKCLVSMALALGMACLLLLVVGSVRYGGPDGLLLRVRAEVAAHQPHPQLVPTPLRAASGAGGASLPQLPQIPQPTPPAGAAQPAGKQAAPFAQAAKSAPQPISHTADPLAQASSSASKPAPTYRLAKAAVELSGVPHVWQKWNNCGPATLAMNLDYFGSQLSQADIATALKPDPDDKNVSPEEMVAFARSQGFHALVRANGDSGRLRLLLGNGVPVLVETWLEQEPGNGMGHYRLLTGYDDAAQQWTLYDSYVSAGVDANQPYRGIHLSYAEMDPLWAVFNRTYVLIYTDALAPTVLGILGDQADNASMWQQALRQAQAEVERHPDDPFATFNLGTDEVALGQFEQAAAAYDRARVIGLPWRMLWYQFGPFQAYYETGRYEELGSLTKATLATADNIEELYYWKGMGLAAQGDAAGARRAWQRALELNSHYAPAAAALNGQGD